MERNKLDDLIATYADRIIDGMSSSDMAQFIFEDLVHNFSCNYAESDLLEQIANQYPDLLESVKA